MLNILCLVAPFSTALSSVSRGFFAAPFQSLALGVSNKVCDVAIVRSFWPVFFKDCGWEGFPLAEDVFDFLVIKYLV